MAVHFADRLIEAIREKNAPVCVGLDPLVERMPAQLLAGFELSDKESSPASVNETRVAGAFLAFGKELIRVIAPHVPAIKINIAFFEPFGPDGIRTYRVLVKEAQQAGLIVIGDVKRADIGHSAAQYARAQLYPLSSGGPTDQATPDSVTVNPYFGYDGIGPFVDVAKENGKGIFILVQTSNSSASQIQGIATAGKSNVGDEVAALVESWAAQEGLVGSNGYSCIGAVVSPRDLPSTERIRAVMPHCIFLVPGFGAQGRTADEVARCFKEDGTGAIVNASRSVIYAYQSDKYTDAHRDNWQACIEHACRDFIETIRSVLSG